MNDYKIIVAVFISVLFSLFYFISIFFMTGRGGIMIAGYHYQPIKKEAMKYHKYIMRRFGAFIFIIFLIIHILTISGIFKVMILFYTMVGFLPIFVICGLVYFSKSQKIKEALRLEKELDENDKRE